MSELLISRWSDRDIGRIRLEQWIANSSASIQHLPVHHSNSALLFTRNVTNYLRIWFKPTFSRYRDVPRMQPVQSFNVETHTEKAQQNLKSNWRTHETTPNLLVLLATFSNKTGKQSIEIVECNSRYKFALNCWKDKWKHYSKPYWNSKIQTKIQ